MRCGVLCVVMVFVLNVHAWRTEYTQMGEREGDECYRQADEVWTCKKDSDCEAFKDILKEVNVNFVPKTCSWQGRTPILCCPPKKQSERITVSKSQEKCTEYAKLLCNNQDLFVLAAQAQPQRKKRQDSSQSNKNSATFEPPPDSIVGGHLTKSREIPSMALIGYGDPGAIIWQCGGSLVSENFVLSAAHCVNTPYGLARWVRLGDLDLRSDSEEARPQQLEIVERVVHPGYHAPAFYNDLALFRLARPVVFDPFVRPACLHSDILDPTGVGTVAGWGKNESNGPRSSALMQVDISFVPSSECKRIVGVIDKYLPNGIDTKTMLCAGELGKDTCQGDSGGPLILPAVRHSSTECLARLVGVTSFGPRNCGVTSVPGAYVRVAHFLSWIESVIWP